MKLAVIKVKSSQFIVKEGDIILTAKLEGEAGDKISFDEVLLTVEGDKTTVGTPYVAKAKVDAEIVSQTKADKIVSFKYKSKSRYRRKRGHRQDLTEIKIVKL